MVCGAGEYARIATGPCLACETGSFSVGFFAGNATAVDACTLCPLNFTTVTGPACGWWWFVVGHESRLCLQHFEFLLFFFFSCLRSGRGDD